MQHVSVISFTVFEQKNSTLSLNDSITEITIGIPYSFRIEIEISSPHFLYSYYCAVKSHRDHPDTQIYLVYLCILDIKSTIQKKKKSLHILPPKGTSFNEALTNCVCCYSTAISLYAYIHFTINSPTVRWANASTNFHLKNFTIQRKSDARCSQSNIPRLANNNTL